MTTIVRVKRHRSDDPVEALVLSCKRKKREESDSENDLFKTVLNFSGTVEDKDDKVATSTVESFKSKESKYANFEKGHIPEIRSKQRQERREKSEENRFTLLSCLRSSNATENSEVDDSVDKENYTIVDVSQDTKEKQTEHDASDGCYVYDLYSMQENDSDFNDLYMENLLSIQPLDTELEYRNGEDCYDEVDPDEDDSNDENNWRNDYPDTDSSMGDEEDDDILLKRLRVCRLDSEDYQMSGDSGEEQYLNYGDEERYHYYEAEDLAGKRYAKYKANAMKQMIEDNYGDTSESDDDRDILLNHESSD